VILPLVAEHEPRSSTQHRPGSPPENHSTRLSYVAGAADDSVNSQSPSAWWFSPPSRTVGRHPSSGLGPLVRFDNVSGVTGTTVPSQVMPSLNGLEYSTSTFLLVPTARRRAYSWQRDTRPFHSPPPRDCAVGRCQRRVSPRSGRCRSAIADAHLIATVVGLLGCRAEDCCMRVRALSGPSSRFWRTYVPQPGEPL
jgi:hypothetical protein